MICILICSFLSGSDLAQGRHACHVCLIDYLDAY